ncbi:MAG TPA: hypothetical protein PLD84_15715, partial [Chitinophagales bacterium]|nr:hypothetical protein [Chitinophagales bacterium]
TIPIRYGMIFTKKLYQVITGMFLLVSIVDYIVLGSNYGIGIGMIISGGVSLLVVSKTHVVKSDYYYIFLVDGMMVLQFLLVALGHAIS